MRMMIPKNWSILCRKFSFKTTLRNYSIVAGNEVSKSKPDNDDSSAFAYTNRLHFYENTDTIPTYRLIDVNGHRLDNCELADIDQNFVLRLYKYMRTIKEMDKILYECQRQGRISFYMTSHGEEGTQIGSAAALNHDDLIFPQYRESGILLWRGFQIEQFVNQCYGNKEDLGKGKQMPVHYGSKEHFYVTVSSPLATQLPQASGAAYAYKLAKNGRCVIAYFGEGSASEGDAHAGFNFAATLECPVIFFCRNNGYAISTPVSEQYRGDGIAGRAAGYGIQAIRVDGNDVLAVYNATKVARSYVMRENKPIILEAMTYRIGHHSTSDDSTAYRSKESIDERERENPITRLQRFMESNGWWDEDIENTWVNDIRKEVLDSIQKAEKIKKPRWQELFNDVYDQMPENLMEQQQYMENHVKKFQPHYPIEEFEKI